MYWIHPKRLCGGEHESEDRVGDEEDEGDEERREGFGVEQ